MPRIRTIKPDLAKHEGLFDLESETGFPIRYVWAVLPCFCDRSGRFEWRSRRLSAEILPYDETADMRRVLDALLTRGFVAKYRVGDAWFGLIPTFEKHQVVNNREKPSDLPDPLDADEVIYSGNHQLGFEITAREARDDDASSTRGQSCSEEGKGKERKGKEGNGGGAPAGDPPPPKKTKRGSRIPEDFPGEIEIQWARRNEPRVDAEREADKFRNHWLSAPGQKGVKLDWPATWRNWILKAAEWGSGKTSKTADDVAAEAIALRRSQGL